MGSQDVAPRSVGNGPVGGCGSQDMASRSGPRKAGNDPVRFQRIQARELVFLYF